MAFPQLSEEFRLKRLEHPGKSDKPIRMVLDTDTYNEIDDQFAVAYSILSSERLNVEAIYAAPFHNDRSTGPGDGMEKSYDEILRLLERLSVSPEGFAFRGSTTYLAGRDAPEASPAAEDLIKKAMAMPEDEPLYVATIGAITNVSSAILLEPEIIKRIVVVWLGGQPHSLPWATEFNLMQDLAASKLVFDCGVPFVQIPCHGVSSHLTTTVPELEDALKGRNSISDFLFERFCDYTTDHFAWAKEIWDISAIGWLLNEEWVPTFTVKSPILTDQMTWQAPPEGRHSIKVAWGMHRNAIFRDMFIKLQNFQKP
jgi:purine nucleosidase